MEHEELQRELDRLRDRIDRIERRLQISPPPGPVRGETTAPPDAVAPTAAPTAAHTAAHTDAPTVAHPDAPAVAHPDAPAVAQTHTPPPTPPVAPPVTPTATPPLAPPVARPRPAPTASRGRPLELLVGAKLAAWVGALILVITAGLLVKLGIDAGLWGRLPASVRCLLVASFGGVMLVLGEIALRRISRAASVGLFGAGLGILYLDAFATSRVFHLVPAELSFVLMGVVAAVGFAVTLRTRFRTIGVLSLVGGYMTPLMMWGSGGELLILVYITALFAVGLGLSAVQPQSFRALRYVTLGLHGLLALACLVDHGRNAWLMSVVFVSGWWAMVLAESIFAALRDQSPLGNPIATLLATAGYVTAGCWLLGGIPASVPGGPGGPFGAAGPGWLGTFTLGVAVLGAASALQFGSGLDGLRGRVRSPMDKLAVALWAQSGVLLAVAVALQFDGFGESVSWLAIVVASVEIGRRLPSRGVDVFGIVVWVLALAHLAIIGLLIAIGFAPGNLDGTVVTLGSVVITRWSLLVLLAVAVSLVVAHRLNDRGPRPWRVVPVLATIAAAVAWLAVWQIQAGGLIGTSLWTLGGLALLGTAPLGRRQRHLEIALGVLAAAGAKWFLVDALATRFTPGWDPAALTPILNGQMLLALVIGAAGWWGAHVLARRTNAAAPIAGWGPVAAALITLVGLTFEIDRMIARAGPAAAGEAIAYAPELLRALWFTALWAVGGMAMILAGRDGRRPPLVTGGWALLALCAVAWLTLETLVYRVSHPPIAAPVLLNLQSGVGVLLIVLLGVTTVLTRQRSPEALRVEGWGVQPAAVAFALIGLAGLWIGSLEIDRALAATPTAAQAGLSVYWAIYGVFLVVIGFARRAAAARYAGLGLLTITVAKVLLVDLATVDRMWRVASFLVSGLLLVGTSVLYTKLSPRLLAGQDDADASDVR